VKPGQAMTRVLLVTHFYSTHRSGIEIAAHRLAQALCDDPQLSIEWMASDCDPVPADLPARLRCAPAAAWNGIEKLFGLPCPLWSPAAILRLWRAVRECDVLHLHDTIYMGNIAAWLFGRILRKPLVVTQHIGAIAYDGWLARNLLSLLNRTVVRMVLSSAERVVFISPAVQGYFNAFCRFRAPPAYIPNGVDTEVFSYADAARGADLRQAAGRDRDRNLMLFAGRFVKRKGIDIVLALARGLPGVDWILAGDGPMRPEDAGLPNVTVVRGRQSAQLASLYQMADLLVLPSKGEGFPLVVQEAMACGTPAMVGAETAAGCCPEVKPALFIEDVMSADAAQIWRDRVALLLAELDKLRALRAGVAKAAREHWSWPAAAQAYASVFREVRPQG
jgi:phosphatidylinositol alpha-1,6-mannosyltransferase